MNGLGQAGFDSGEQFADVEGFGNVVAGPEGEAEFEVADAVADGEEEDGDAVAAIADFAADGQAVGVGHFDVEDEEGRVLGLPFVQRFAAIVGGDDGVAFTFEGGLDEGEDVRIVVGQQDFVKHGGDYRHGVAKRKKAVGGRQ